MDSHIYVYRCFSTQNALDYFKETRESDGRQGSSESIDNARHAVEDEAMTQRDRLSSRVTAEFGRPSTSTP
jgi:tyrosine-protein phosphatase YwqE